MHQPFQEHANVQITRSSRRSQAPVSLPASCSAGQYYFGFGGENAVAFSVNDNKLVPANGNSGGYIYDYIGGGRQTVGTTITVSAINANNQVVGTGPIAAPQAVDNAILYSSGVIQYLGAPAGANDSHGYALNDLGQVAGGAVYSYPYGDISHAVTCSGGTWTDLGSIPGGDDTWATGINHSGQVVGQYGYVVTGSIESGGYGTVPQAFVYVGGVMTDLGALGGDAAVATAINSSGQIVGYSSFPGVMQGSRQSRQDASDGRAGYK